MIDASCGYGRLHFIISVAVVCGNPYGSRTGNHLIAAAVDLLSADLHAVFRNYFPQSGLIADMGGLYIHKTDRL